MDLKTLERMTVLKLREEALKIEGLDGVRGMSKEELVRAIAAANKIPLEGRKRGGAGNSDLKKQIRELRAAIVEAIRAKEKKRLRRVRRQVKRLKRETRRLSSPAGETGATTPA